MTSTSSLARVVALVTGGSSGLGAATVSALVSRGARVMVADLVESSSSSSRDAEINSNLSFSATDVTSESQVNQTLDQVEHVFGEPVNVAVNCAGIAIAKKTLSRHRGGAETPRDHNQQHRHHIPHSLEDFTKTLQINTIGTFNTSRLVAARMDTNTNNKNNIIINTASIAAYEGQCGQVAYATSKAAIVGMTFTMARDLAPFGIRVMGIAPGLFETPLLTSLPESVRQELGDSVPFPSRLGHPHEFGQLVIHMIENSYLNGSTIRLDGALRMPP